MRGDIITKIKDYDARDLTHIDAQNMFKTSVSSIPLVVRRYIGLRTFICKRFSLAINNIPFLSCYNRSAIVKKTQR